MFYERVNSPLTGSVAEVPVRGRYACVVECGLKAFFAQGAYGGHPVIGGMLIDLKSFEDNTAESFIRIKGASANALGYQHGFAVVSSDDLEALRSIQPKTFSPYFEASGTAPAAGAFEFMDHVQIYTPGRLSALLNLTMVAPGAGSVLHFVGADKVPATGIFYLSEGLDEGDSQGIRLPAVNGFVHAVTETIFAPGEYRLIVQTIGADVVVGQLGSVAL